MATLMLANGSETEVDEDVLGWALQWAGRWRLDSHGYAVRRSRSATVLLHREIMRAPPGTDVDHIDRNPLNNRRANLRVCTRSENTANAKKSRANTSGYKGVDFHRSVGRWRGRLTINYQQILVGWFDSAAEAGKAVDEAARRLRGPFARFNFPRNGEPSAWRLYR